MDSQAEGYQNKNFSIILTPSKTQNFGVNSSPLYRKDLSNSMYSPKTGLKLFGEQANDDNEIARSLPLKSHFVRLNVIFMLFFVY